MAATNHAMTKQMYNQMKPYLRKPADDFLVMKRFGYSKSVVQMVRNTKDWHEYEQRLHRFGGYPRKKSAIGKSPEAYVSDFYAERLKEASDENIRLKDERRALVDSLEEVKELYHKARINQTVLAAVSFTFGVVMTLILFWLQVIKNGG